MILIRDTSFSTACLTSSNCPMPLCFICRISRANTTPGEPNAPQIFSGIKSAVGSDVLRSESGAATTSQSSAESVLCIDNLGIASAPPEGERPIECQPDASSLHIVVSRTSRFTVINAKRMSNNSSAYKKNCHANEEDKGK
jgi:hypothetical protein